MFAEVENTVDLTYELPESKFDHIFKPSRHMSFFMEFEPAIKNSMGQTGGTMPNYFTMIEELQSHIGQI